MSAARHAQVSLLLETGGGGSGRHLLDLYAGLRKRGWDARVLLSAIRMDAGFATEVADLPPEHVTFLNLRRAPHITDVAAIARIKRHLNRQNGPHLLHAHSTKAGMLGWALRSTFPCRILTPHAYRGMDPNLSRYRATVIRRAEGVFSRSFNAVIAVSEDEQRYTSTLGIDCNSVHYIPNGVNAAPILATVKGVRRDRSAGGPVIGFVGRLVYQKHPLLFLQVLAAVVESGVDARAVIVGDGPLLPSLLEMAAALKIADRIEWMGAVRGVPELGKVDVLVHTSVYESSPYSLLEAVAADIPVIACENAGSRSIFGDLLPEAIPAQGSPDSLAKAVLAVLQNDSLLQRYRSQYPLIMQQFSADRMIEQTIAVYEQVLETAC